MDAFNGFNDTIDGGVFDFLMEAEVTGAALVFLIMQRIGVYGFLLAIIATGILMVLPQKSQEFQEVKQRLVRVAIGAVLFFGFFAIVGLIGSLIDVAINN